MWRGKSEPQIDADEMITQNEKFADRHSAKSHHQCESAVQTIEADRDRTAGVRAVRIHTRLRPTKRDFGG